MTSVKDRVQRAWDMGVQSISLCTNRNTNNTVRLWGLENKRGVKTLVYENKKYCIFMDRVAMLEGIPLLQMMKDSEATKRNRANSRERYRTRSKRKQLRDNHKGN